MAKFSLNLFVVANARRETMLNFIKFARRGSFVKFYSDGGLKFCVRAASIVKYHHLSARAFLKFHPLDVRFFKFHNFAACALRRTEIFYVVRFLFAKNPRKVGLHPALGR